MVRDYTIPSIRQMANLAEVTEHRLVPLYCKRSLVGWCDMCFVSPDNMDDKDSGTANFLESKLLYPEVLEESDLLLLLKEVNPYITWFRDLCIDQVV